jgi:glycosyltransferase involved in cell wall biosynthesis
MRIAYVITGLSLGGSETQLARLALATHKTDDIVVISLLQGGELASKLEKAGVKVVHLRCTQPWHVVGRLREALRKHKPEVVYSWLWHANMGARFASRGIAPVVCSIRGKEKSTVRYWLDKLTRPLVTHYTTNSHYIADFYRLKKEHRSVIYNGVPQDIWKGKKHKPKQKHAIMVGRLTWEKDFLTLIDAAALAPDWHFSIAGGGAREDELKEKIRAAKVKNVTLLGQRNDVPDLLVESTCYVHLAFTEGSPNTIIEAMLFGVPVIGSDIPALRELIAHRGLLVAEQDPHAVVKALRTIEKRKEKTDKKTMQWARNTFSEKRMVEESREVLDRVRHRRNN